MIKEELFTLPTETSWHFERKRKPDDKTVGNYTLIQPGAVDIAKVVKAYAHHPVAAYNIASIEIIYNEQSNREFLARMVLMNRLKGNERFAPLWKTTCQGEEKSLREQTYQKLKALSAAYTDPTVPNIMLLPLWHGTSDEVAPYIFETGYGIFDDPKFTTDPGFFGNGVYTAHEAEYAFRCYAEKKGDKAVLLLNWVSTFETYPVIGSITDDLTGQLIKACDIHTLMEIKRGYDKCDAHFIPVYAENHPVDKYYPCKYGEEAQYHEMVVFNAAQCLPRYKVKLIRNNPHYGMNEKANEFYETAMGFLASSNYQDALNFFEDAAYAGHPCAFVRLHGLYSGASGVMPVDVQRLEKYQAMSEDKIKALKDKAHYKGENDQEAQFNLGWCYQQGLGVDRNFAKAAEYYWIAANQGHRDAQYHLGVCCSAGMGVKQDMKQAIFYYEKAATQGHVHANYVLYQAYELGLGVAPDPVKAASFKLAAQKGQHPQLANSGLPMSRQLSSNPQPVVNNTEDKKRRAQLEAELKTIKAEKGELEKALQEAYVDAQYMLKLQIQEYQKQLEKEKQAQISQPKTPSGTGTFWFFSYFFKGNETPKSQPVRDEKNLNLLLKWVVEGHLEEVENLLQLKPELALMEGNIKDLSGREFKDITALQYAHWALDAEMMEVIVKYTDKAEVLNQLKSFESNPAKYSMHGVHYNNGVLLQKMTEYLNNYNYSEWSIEQRKNYWQKEIGGAQRMCPAWLVYAMCEEGTDVAWTKKDVQIKVKREYDKEHLKWWFDKEYNGGKMGAKWGAGRGCDYACRSVDGNSRWGEPWWLRWGNVDHDQEVHGKYGKQSVKVVEDLKTQLITQNYSSVSSGTLGNELLKSQSESQTFIYLQSQQPKVPSGTSSFFQGNTPPKSQPVRDEKNLNLLLKWVVEGHLEEAEKLLKSKPELALMEGNVKDLSGREFKDITALQYAHWALDAEMMEVIIKYTDKVEVLNQLKTFESNPGKYSAHGLHYDNSVLLQKMTEYLNNYSKWSNEQRVINYWQKEIGGAQRMCPAWLVYAMCEEGGDVAWTRKDEKRKVKRQYEKEHLKWWFDKEYNGGKLGDKWGAGRAYDATIEGHAHEKPRNQRYNKSGILGEPGLYYDGIFLLGVHHLTPVSRHILAHDHEVHGRFGKQSIKVVDDLKTSLMTSHNNMGNIWKQ